MSIKKSTENIRNECNNIDSELEYNEEEEDDLESKKGKAYGDPIVELY